MLNCQSKNGSMDSLNFEIGQATATLSTVLLSTVEIGETTTAHIGYSTLSYIIIKIGKTSTVEIGETTTVHIGYCYPFSALQASTLATAYT